MNSKTILAIAIAGTLLACKKELLLNPGTDKLSARALARATAYNPNESDSAHTMYKPSAAYETLFTDRFFSDNIEKNNNWWKYRTGSITYNGFTGYNAAANVEVNTANSRTVLYLKFKEEANGNFTGGGIISSKKLGYGYYEARVNLYTATYGLHQSFWNKSDAIEIDAFELDSKMWNDTEPRRFSPNRHRWLPVHNQYSKTTTQKNNETQLAHVKNSASTTQWNYNDGQWVTIGWEWLPDKVIYYTNGVKTNEFATTDGAGTDLNVYSPANLYLSALPFDAFVAPSVVTPLDSAAMRVEYFSYSAKPLLNVNLLGNYSFEYHRPGSKDIRPDSWSEGAFYNGTTTLPGDTAATYGLKDTGTNTWYLEHKSPNAAAYKANAWQTLSFIPNGKYKLTAKLKCTAHSKTNGLMIQVLDKDRTTVLCTRTILGPVTNWTTLNINYDVALGAFYPINVQNNEVVIIIKSDANATETLQVDELSFQYTGP